MRASQVSSVYMVSDIPSSYTISHDRIKAPVPHEDSNFDVGIFLTSTVHGEAIHRGAYGIFLCDYSIQFRFPVLHGHASRFLADKVCLLALPDGGLAAVDNIDSWMLHLQGMQI